MNTSEGIFTLMFMLVGMSIPLLFIYTEYRKRKHLLELHYRERMAAIEKGLPLPPLPASLTEGPAWMKKNSYVTGEHSGAPERVLLHGLVWLCVGIGICAIGVIGHDGRGYVGLIPASIGAAYLIYHAIAGRKAAVPSDIPRAENPPPPMT